MTTHYMFQEFTGDTGEWHRVIVVGKLSITLFENRGDQGLSPVTYYLSSFNGLIKNAYENNVWLCR